MTKAQMIPLVLDLLTLYSSNPGSDRKLRQFQSLLELGKVNRLNKTVLGGIIMSLIVALKQGGFSRSEILFVLIQNGVLPNG